MMTFKLGSWKMGGGRVLPAESSQTAVSRLNELALPAPVIESQPAKTVEIPKPARPPKKIECFYSNGARTQRLKVWVSFLPLSLILALGLCLYIKGASEWIAGSVMLGGFVVFSLVGLLIEYQRLKAFVCPCCQAPIKDWDTNETHRILFNCARCGSRWDIEYKERPYPAGLRLAHLSTLCDPKGAH